MEGFVTITRQSHNGLQRAMVASYFRQVRHLEHSANSRCPEHEPLPESQQYNHVEPSVPLCLVYPVRYNVSIIGLVQRHAAPGSARYPKVILRSSGSPELLPRN